MRWKVEVIERGKEKKEKEIENRLCAELEIIKVSYALPSISTNNVIFYESLQFQMRKLILVYIRKVFFEFVPVYNTAIFGSLLTIFVSSVTWNNE